MKKLRYVFLKEDLLIGGTELLIERIGVFLDNQDNNITIITKSVVPEILERYKKRGLEVIIINKWDKKSFKEILNDLNSYLLRVITFSLEDFCMVYVYKNPNVKTLLYTVYFNQLIIGGKTNNKTALNLVKSLSAKILDDMLSSHNIVCMDEHTAENTYTYYGRKIKFPKNKVPFLRIPVDIVGLKTDEIKKKAILKTNNILTIARADFPWKGYMLGLMEYVAENWEKYDLKLHIVTYGEGEDKIISKYNSLSPSTRERISIQGKTDYNELEELYSATKLYIGQGTTVLDAAQRGIITIPVVPDTYQVLAEEFFHDNPTRVTVPTDTDNNFELLINQFYDLKPEEYCEAAIKGRELVIENYGTEAICNGIKGYFENIPDNSYGNKYVRCFNASKELKHLLSTFIHRKQSDG